jgi:glycosyltransferase involved in cell wall biosynthesis
MKPNILHIFPNFKVGGAQMRFALLSEKLSENFSHTILSIDGNQSAAGILPRGADVIFAHKPPARRLLPARLGAYRKRLHALAPDLLVTYNWGSIEWAAANNSTPHIHFEDGFGPEEVDRQLRRRVLFRRFALRRSRIVVPSLLLQDIATRVWRLNAERVQYIPNGIEPKDGFTTRLEDLAPGLSPQQPRIAWVGALRAEKNLVKLLRAFAPLKERAVLVVIGDGPERERALQEAERLSLGASCRFLGNRTDVRDILQQCDILALSSDTEQMPISILEGMDAGLAIASVDVGDVRHMVSPPNKPLITTRSEQALNTALNTLVTEKGVRKSIGEANRAHLRQHYDFQTMLSTYQKLFANPLSITSVS